MRLSSFSSVLVLLVGLVGCGGASDASSDGSQTEDAIGQRRSLDEIHWNPTSAKEWEIVPAIKAYQADLPAEVAEGRAKLTVDALTGGVSWSWPQLVSETVGGEPEEMAVELSMQRIPVPFETFVARIPVASWGLSLAHRLGGAVKVYTRDANGRPVRQVERMVLSALPCDQSIRLLDNDMTKVEVIEYGADQATVYWRVRHSDNGSTASDVGSVNFRRQQDGSTLATFHSAHRLRALGLVPLPPLVIMPALQTVFLEHLAHYAQLAR